MSASLAHDSDHSSIKAEVTELEIAVPMTIVETDAATERRIIRRVDRKLLPFLAIVYSIALIDRSNMSVARIAGMGEDLGLDIGNRYSVISCLFFVPYILLQLPSNLVLRHIGPHICITFYVVSWGAVQLSMAFVPSWEILCICRVLLGLFEAGFFPGMVFIITTWYKRHEVQKRLAAFYLTSICIGGFSSILAYAIQLLKGKRGLNGWQWIFIVEGGITLALGIATWFLLEAFPDQNKFLTKEETDIVLSRVEKDRGDSLPDKITVSKVLHHMGDWTIWAYALCFMSSTMPAYVISYFGVIILQSMGWGLAASFILLTPPFVFAAITTYLFAYISDRMKMRALWIVVQTLITLAGLFITGYATNNGARYFGLTNNSDLITADVETRTLPHKLRGIWMYPRYYSICISFTETSLVHSLTGQNANNVLSHSKRSVSSAMIVSWGGIGGIFATTVFRQQDFPRYMNGIWATIGCQLLMLFLLGLLTVTYSRRNRLAREERLIVEGQPGFFYTL